MASYISGNIKGLSGVRCDLISQATSLRIQSVHSVFGGVWKFDKPVVGIYNIEFYGRDVSEADWIYDYVITQDDPYLGGDVTYTFWNGTAPYADSKIVKENEFGWFSHSQLKFHIDAEGESANIDITAIYYRIFYNGSWAAWTPDAPAVAATTHSLDIDIAGLANIEGENNIIEFYVTFDDGTQDMVTTVPFKYDGSAPIFNITAGAAVGGFNRIGLDWTNVDVSDALSGIGYIIIYRDTNDSFSGAEEIARLVVVDQSIIPSSHIDNTMPTNDQSTKYFYWGKAMDRSGNLSAEARLDTAALGTAIILLLPADVDGALRIQNNPDGVNWEVIYGIHVPIQAVIITAGILANVTTITAIQYKADDADTWHDIPTPQYNGKTISYPYSVAGMTEGETLTFLYTAVIQDMKYHRVVFDHADAETEITLCHFESILAADIIVGGILRLEKGMSIWTGSFDANGAVTGAGMFIDKAGLEMWDAAGDTNQRLNNDGSATFGRAGVAQITISTAGVITIDSKLLNITGDTIFEAGYDPVLMRQVFTSQPTPPYYIDDIWLDGTDIFKTDTERVPPASFTAGDWSLATDYDNSGDKSTRWYSPSTLDPSAGWTAQEKIDHDGDQWVKTDLGNQLWSWDGLITVGWVQDYTQIDGGHINTRTISAEKIRIGGGTEYTTDILFEADDSTNRGDKYVKWNSGTIVFANGNTKTTIPLGTLQLVANPQSWVYYNATTNTILLTATYADSIGDGKALMAIINRGDYVDADNRGLCIITVINSSGTTIDGDKIVTGKIQSWDGNTYFDLVNNEIVMADGRITGVTVIDSDLLNINSDVNFDPGYDPNTKRQHYSSEPTTPYWVDDLWTDGTDFKRCTAAKTSAQAYDAGDWELATNYDASGDPGNIRWRAAAADDPSDTWSGTDASHEGDQWVKTDFGNKLFTWTGTAWVQDYTQISGGHIDAYSIDADKISIGAVPFTTDVLFEPDNVHGEANYIKWSAGDVEFASGESKAVSAGYNYITAPQEFMYLSGTTILGSTNYADAVGIGKTLMALVVRGDTGGQCIITPMQNFGTTLDGDKVVTGKIQSIDGNSYFDLINNAIQMVDGILKTSLTGDRVEIDSTDGIKIYRSSGGNPSKLTFYDGVAWMYEITATTAAGVHFANATGFRYRFYNEDVEIAANLKVEGNTEQVRGVEILTIPKNGSITLNATYHTVRHYGSSHIVISGADDELKRIEIGVDGQILYMEVSTSGYTYDIKYNESDMTHSGDGAGIVYKGILIIDAAAHELNSIKIRQFMYSGQRAKWMLINAD